MDSHSFSVHPVIVFWCYLRSILIYLPFCNNAMVTLCIVFCIWTNRNIETENIKVLPCQDLPLKLKNHRTTAIPALWWDIKCLVLKWMLPLQPGNRWNSRISHFGTIRSTELNISVEITDEMRVHKAIQKLQIKGKIKKNPDIKRLRTK